jgi:hypothetical protein
LLRICGPTPHPIPPRRKSGGREEFLACAAANKAALVLGTVLVICDRPAWGSGRRQISCRLAPIGVYRTPSAR